MNLTSKFSHKAKSILMLLALGSISGGVHAISEQDQQIDLIVKGKVSKGTCSFAFSNKVVEFTKPLVSADIGDVMDATTPTEPFTIQYICQDYTDDVIPDLQVSIKADGNSNTLNEKLFPKNNITNAAFTLSQCNIVNTDCSLVDFFNNNTEIDFPVHNGENEKYFQAKVVKLYGSPIKSGKLSASVIFSFVQP